MNYLRLYINICKRGEKRLYPKRKRPEEFYERHHTFPKSLYGNNSRISVLTIKEHFIAHLLLIKICINRYGKDSYKTKKMQMAVHKMVYRLGSSQRYIFNARQYEKARECAALAKRGVKRTDLLGKKFFGASEEKIRAGMKKMADGKRGKPLNYPKSRKSRGKHSTETIEKIKKTKQNTNEKYIRMSADEFILWMKSCKMHRSDGRKNGNVIRAINARGETVEQYYGNK